MTTAKQYTDVQFVGHVLCTTPKLDATVEGQSDWGTYLGADNDADDIQARLAIVANVLAQVVVNTNIDNSSTTLKVFTLPEFFWRGVKGAYFNSNGNDDLIYKQVSAGLITMIQHTNKDLSDWLFLFGSILTTGDVTACRSDIDPTLAKIGDDFLNAYHVLNELEGKDTLKPLSTLMQIADEKIVAENNTDQKLSDLLSSMLDMGDELATKYVYNRCFVYYGTQELAIQKENKSKEDFILNNPTGTPNAVNHYLQAMVNYPAISATNNPIAILPHSTFMCANVTIGVEICVDHCCARLSNYVFQKNIEPVDIQIVISSGMQLMIGSVATKVDGILFNCDGEYQMIGDADNGVQCHTQLKTYTSVAGAAPGLSNHIPAVQIITLPPPEATAPVLFPEGLGDIHIYAPQKITTC